MQGLDYAVIGAYVVVIIFLSLYLTRRASASLQDYFLGGRKLPWYLLGASGMASWFDATGTALICSFLFMIGPRGLFIEFRGGAVLVLAFALCFAGKWHRRSGCITGAEWNTFRFGEGAAGEAARLVSAIIAILTGIGMMGYLARGAGLFFAMYLPFTPTQVTVVLLAFVAVYTMLSGFYGVVFTDLIQSIVIIFVAIYVSVVAFQAISGVDALGAVAEQVTGNARWTSSALTYKAEMPEGYGAYEALFTLALFYFVRNALGGLGSGGEPKYFAARNDRECGLLSLLVAFMISFRWPMIMGFAVLGLFMVNDAFPEKSTLPEATALIKEHHPDVERAGWHDLTSGIAYHPEDYDAGLVASLQGILGEKWESHLQLIGYDATVNPERILSAVILNLFPAGLRGLILVGLLAACMSTFDSFLNMTSGFFVRDIYQRWIRPKAPNKELILMAYVAIAFTVVGGLFLGLAAGSINELWDWIAMSLTAGAIAPSLLRLYWWRFNGWGVAGGLVLGGIGAVLQKIYFPDMTPQMKFMLMTGLSFLGAIPVSLLTAPAPQDVLDNFYRVTRPFGWWRPMRRSLAPETLAAIDTENRNDVIALPFALMFQILLFLLPMQIVIHSWTAFGWTFLMFIPSCVGLYWFWYRNLGPSAAEEHPDCAAHAKAALAQTGE